MEHSEIIEASLVYVQALAPAIFVVAVFNSSESILSLIKQALQFVGRA